MKKTHESAEIQKELENLFDEEKKEVLPRFFKTGKGEYGEGDCFIGVTVPLIRSVAKKHLQADGQTLLVMLSSPWHEVRMCALLILVAQYAKSDAEKKEKVYRYYLAHTAGINNWDLVDLSAPKIVGDYLKNKGEDERQVLYRLSESACMWKQRIAIVATMPLIKNGDFNDTLRLAERYLHHPHDLMHKATGWMLREVGKKEEAVLCRFLDNYATEMPRTMLRYAIEKMDEKKRRHYLEMR
jgi:3-methyladenine DNA glycosylase AlkD